MSRLEDFQKIILKEEKIERSNDVQENKLDLKKLNKRYMNMQKKWRKYMETIIFIYLVCGDTHIHSHAALLWAPAIASYSDHMVGGKEMTTLRPSIRKDPLVRGRDTVLSSSASD